MVRIKIKEVIIYKMYSFVSIITKSYTKKKYDYKL